MTRKEELRHLIVMQKERRKKRIQSMISENLLQSFDAKCKSLNVSRSSAIEQLIHFFVSDSADVMISTEESRNQLAGFINTYNKLTPAFRQELIVEDLDSVQAFLNSEEKEKDEQEFDDMINAQ